MMLSLPSVDLGEPDSPGRILDALTQQGLAIVHGLQDRGTVLRTAATIMAIRTHRDSDADGVTAIEQRVGYAATGSLAGFTDRELHPHTEGSAVERPPGLLLLACLRPAEHGGTTILVDAAVVYAEIAATDPDMLEALSTSRSAFFGGASGHLGSIFAACPDGRIRVRMRFDDMIRLAPAAALYRDKLRGIVRQHEICIALGAGDGYVLLNDRWLHGRTRFTGSRVMLRLLGDAHPRRRLPSGFAAPNHPSRGRPDALQVITGHGMAVVGAPRRGGGEVDAGRHRA